MTTPTARPGESTLLLRLDGRGTLYQQTYRALRGALAADA